MSDNLRIALDEAYRAVELAVARFGKYSKQYLEAIAEYQSLVAIAAGGGL